MDIIQYMEIVKLLKDYATTSNRGKYGEYLHFKLDSSICVEKITNKNFMIKYLQPLNDLIIYTTELPCANIKRVVQ